MRRFFAALLLILVVLVAVVLLRATTLASVQVAAAPMDRASLDEQGLTSRLSAAIRLPTISHLNSADNDPAVFRAFHRLLEREFPRVHAALEREEVSELSLLYRWRGREPHLQPALFAAHIDVVPVEPGTESAWLHPPFSGALAEGFLWGRGALDDKVNLLAQLEAVESLLAQGFQPRRTLYFGFGHDEEVGGSEGAAKIAQRLMERDIQLAFVLDEGGIVSSQFVPGIDAQVAVVGVAEKGYVSFELTAHASGGHSSMPPQEQSIVLLAQAIARIDAQRPPARLSLPVRAMLRHMAPETGLGTRLVLANLWLFGPLLLWVAPQEPALDAFVRTTTAPTLLHAGIKDNVVPASAQATVNFRILPGETADQVEAHLARVIDDSRIEIRRYPHARDPSRASRFEGPAWDLLAATIRGTFPGTLVVPYLVAGGTDARHYRDLSENVYRFAPIELGIDDRARLHGSNERIATDAYFNAIHFYRSLMKGLDTLPEADRAPEL